ncbi:hypothetical protein ACFQ3C_13615 [Seohaeicola saemankumensis]|uniref:DUF4189 domain-containing protein n=1 Tax=Seohaeicola saemankumensis TaxID=481181 RepID=A0ABW3TGK5_9RHOB
MNTSSVSWPLIPLKIGLLKVGVLLLLAGCTMTLEDRELPQDPYGWHGAGKIVTLANIGDSAELRRGYAEMARGAVYFGALHIDPVSARYAYARNWNSIEAAITVSAAVCARDAGRPCTLAALALPDPLPPGTRRARGFSVQTLHQFRLLYADVQKQGLWGAYAISPLAAQGFSAQEPSEAAARQTALQNCTFRLEAELTQIGPTGAAAARKAGLDRCEVVHVSTP